MCVSGIGDKFMRKWSTGEATVMHSTSVALIAATALSAIQFSIAVDSERSDYVYNDINGINPIYSSVELSEYDFSEKMNGSLDDQPVNVSSISANMTEVSLAAATTPSFERDAVVNGSIAHGQSDDDNYWALFAIVLVVGTAAGNILVCLAITWERRLQNVTNYFLMSLAITDLMVAILVMPLGTLILVKGKPSDDFVPSLIYPQLDLLRFGSGHRSTVDFVS